MIFHMPHSSKCIPAEVKPALLLNERELEQELILMTDAYTDELFGAHALPEDTIVTFPISRLAVDPERFPDDNMEEMARVGMGVIYTKTAHGRELRKAPSPKERKKLICTYYFPHHECLTQSTVREMAQRGHALIIDCHSFPSSPLPYEKDQHPIRPDICIGIDGFHTPTDLVERIEEVAKDLGMTCARNRPFDGSLVPLSLYKQDTRVLSIMIEVNRKLYMDENDGSKSAGLEGCKRRLGTIIAHARDYIESELFSAR
jgi:N-formylglutamate amidohydrolase